MRAVGVREFKNKASKMFRVRKPLLITKRAKPTGVYIPLCENNIRYLPTELKQEIFAVITNNIAKKLEHAGISEEEIIEEFAKV